MARKKAIPCAHVATIIEHVARQASLLAYNGVEGAIESPFEELSVGELLEWMKENLDGQEFVLEAVK